MASRVGRPCQSQGCTNVVANGRYCGQCAAEQGADEARPSAAKRGYGHNWRKLRGMVLAKSPLCADPFGLHSQANESVVATDVDHIVARTKGGSDSPSNLQSLCHSCHSRKTALVDNTRPQGKGGVKKLEGLLC